MKRLFSSLMILLFLIPRAKAFVENVTHGYVNCMACHISPSGGGILTDYGRSLSNELMSTWGWKNSENSLFGLAKETEILKIGGDIRWLQTYFENSEIKQGQQFVMQKNVELGLHTKSTWFIGALGTREGPGGVPQRGQFLSERHYLLWETSEESRVRIGKFRLHFGLGDPNHTRVTKSPLGFGSNTETYNLEFSKMTEFDEIFLTATLGRLDLPRDQTSERALSITFAKYLGSKAKAGISALLGESALQRRSLAGLFAIFPFLDQGVFKFESDFQRSTLASIPSKSVDLFASHFSAGYQLTKGLIPYLSYEYLHRDISDSKARESSPGFGIQWLPIPHIEILAEYKRQAIGQSMSNSVNNVGFFLFHLYL